MHMTTASVCSAGRRGGARPVFAEARGGSPPPRPHLPGEPRAWATVRQIARALDISLRDLAAAVEAERDSDSPLHRGPDLSDQRKTATPNGAFSATPAALCETTRSDPDPWNPGSALPPRLWTICQGGHAAVWSLYSVK